jgi:flagellar biogenesis protein FliO
MKVIVNMAGETDFFTMATMAWNSFGIFIIIILVGAGVFLVFKFIKDKKDYNKKAILVRFYGNMKVPISDVFKFVFDKNKNLKYYYGKKSKAKIDANTFESIEKDEANKDFLLIANPAPDEYLPMKIEELSLAPILSSNKKAWYVYSMKDNFNRFEILDWLGKYANVIALVGIVILMMINFIFQGAVLDKTNSMMGALTEQVDGIRASTENQYRYAEMMNIVLDKALNLSQLIRDTGMINVSGQVVSR